MNYQTYNIGSGKLDLRFDNLITPLILEGRHLRTDNDIKNFQYKILHALIKLEVGIREFQDQLYQLENDEEERKKYESHIDLLKKYHLIVRMIGSVIPWQLLQNWEISALSQNPPPGHIIGKKGFKAEIKLFREQFGINGDVIILSDLTHCLTVGDAVKICKDGTAEVIEVKSGKKARLTTSQRSRMKNAESYMEKGICQSDNLVLTKQWHFASHNWSNLESLLNEAKTKGFAVNHPQPSITYLAVKTKEDVSEKTERFLLNFRDKPKFNPFVVSVLSYNIAGAHMLRGVAPPTIFKISDRHVIEILKGNLDVVSFFSPFHPKLTDKLTEIGFSFEIIDADKMNSPVDDNWTPVTKKDDGTPQYLVCRKMSNNKFILIDQNVIKLIMTFESEKSLLVSLIQIFDEMHKYEEKLPDFKESFSGNWNIKPQEQLLRSWDAKLMKYRRTHNGLDEKTI